MMKRFTKEDLLRRQCLTKDLKELESESEISGGALSSNALKCFAAAAKSLQSCPTPCSFGRVCEEEQARLELSELLRQTRWKQGGEAMGRSTQVRP